MSIFLFIVILSVLVIIHELGHFIAAKKSGVKVEEFGIGYPPRAIKLFSWKGTDFTFNWIPFGGFVRMSGEEGPVEGKAKSDEKKGQFFAVSATKKLLIILAGPGVNFFFGVIVFATVFTKLGIPQEIEEARVGFIAPNSPAQEAGIPTQVTITAIVDGEDHISTPTTQAVIETIKSLQGKTVTVLTTGNCAGLQCDQTEHAYEAYLRTNDEIPDGQGSLGVAFDPVVYAFYPWWQMPFRSIIFGTEQAFLLSSQIVMALGQLVTDVVARKTVPDQIAGPVGIVHQAQTSGLFDQGVATLLTFSAMLSINLAVMNVLPIPPLDGGRALLITLEKFAGRKRTEKLEYYLNYAGYSMLLALIIVVTVRDVARIFGF